MATILAGTYFFPGGYEHYVAPWPFTGVSEVRFYANVIRGIEGGQMRGVWAETRAGLLATFGSDLAGSVPIERRGIFSTDWQPLSDIGDAWVGIVLEASEDFDSAVISVGLAQIDAR